MPTRRARRKLETCQTHPLSAADCCTGPVLSGECRVVRVGGSIFGKRACRLAWQKDLGSEFMGIELQNSRAMKTEFMRLELRNSPALNSEFMGLELRKSWALNWKWEVNVAVSACPNASPQVMGSPTTHPPPY